MILFQHSFLTNTASCSSRFFSCSRSKKTLVFVHSTGSDCTFDKTTGDVIDTRMSLSEAYPYPMVFLQAYFRERASCLKPDFDPHPLKMAPRIIKAFCHPLLISGGMPGQNQGVQSKAALFMEKKKECEKQGTKQGGLSDRHTQRKAPWVRSGGWEARPSCSNESVCTVIRPGERKPSS